MGRLYQYYLQVVKRALFPKVSARHTELSIISSVDDDIPPSKQLLDMAVTSVKNASTATFSTLSDKTSDTFMNIWPGEHYKILAGIVQTMKPKIVIEIGTASGMSAFALQEYLPKTSKLYTFDIVAWDKIIGTLFRKEDFADGRLVQYVENPADIEVIKKHKEIFRNADLLFIDAAKDGKFEYDLWDNFKEMGLKEGAILVFDDIKEWDMLHFWSTRDMPKIDLTSFGHWAGTGIIEWKTRT